MEPRFIFEDKDLVVLEKPSGMVVNRVESAGGETVQDWVEKKILRYKQSLLLRNEDTKILSEKHQKKSPNILISQYPNIFDFVRRAGIVHRLDKETSGLLLAAKTPEAFENLQRQFKERVVKKRYLALVHGEVRPSEGEIKAPVGRLPWNRERFGVLPGGREATTRYKVIKPYTLHPTPCTLLELTPHTGRTHQIRIHLKYIGHPVVGDPSYAGRKTARSDRTWCPRLFLHAAYLGFRHPVGGKWVEFESNLPEDLETVLRKILNSKS